MHVVILLTIVGNVKISKEAIAKEFNKDILIGVEETVSIKEDKVKSKNKPKKTVDNVELDVYTSDRENNTTDSSDVSLDAKVVEVNRTLRTREDGSSYHEIEYSDGSMTEEFYQNGPV